jgi:hypothetical protein
VIDGAVQQVSASTKPLLFELQNRYWIKLDNIAMPALYSACIADATELLFQFAFWLMNVGYSLTISDQWMDSLKEYSACSRQQGRALFYLISASWYSAPHNFTCQYSIINQLVICVLDCY